MAYNTKAIKTDVNAKPIPQLYNPVTDEYEVLQGTGGAARQVLYGPDGQPVSVADNKLAVRAAELETKLEAVRVLLNTLAGEDFATQTTLAQILGKMIAAPATEARQAEAIAALGGLLQQLQAGSPVSVTDSNLPTGAATAERQEAARALLDSLNKKDLATSAKQEALAALVGTLSAAAVSDPTKSGAVIALLKGVLSRLQAVEGKIDGITTEDGNVKSQLTGSKVKNAFEIIPDDATDLSHETIAIYVGFDGDLKVDLVGGDTVTMYNLAAGAWHPIQAKRVYATGTAATYILGAY